MVISENSEASTYKVFPSTGLVVGFQYSGQLASVATDSENKLSSAGITGIADSVKVFRSITTVVTSIQKIVQANQKLYLTNSKT